MGLVDTILSRHTNTPPFRSCNKGNNVIDFALCSPSILSCITSSAYEPFMINTMSDHRGIVIDFDTQELLGKHEHIVSPDKRGLNANNPIQVDKFLEALQKYWTKYDIKNRISNAMNNTKTTDIRLVVNSIDKDITKAMLKAERKVSKPNRPPWSPALKQASLLVKYYKLLRRQLLLNIDLSTAIQHTKRQLEFSPIQPRNHQDHQTLLRKAQKSLKKIR